MAERFHYDYSEAELDQIANRASDLSTQADAVHVVFNNNARDFAPRAAERLRVRLGQITLPKAKPYRLKQGNLF